MTDARATPARTGAGPSVLHGYGRLWRAVPRELGYLLAGFPLAIIGFLVTVGFVAAGAALLAVFVGVFLITATLYIARGLGSVELTRLRWAGVAAVKAPEWPRGAVPDSTIDSIVRPFLDGHYWLYLLHAVVVAPIASLLSGVITAVWGIVGVGGIVSAASITVGGSEVLSWPLPGWFPAGPVQLGPILVEPAVVAASASSLLGVAFLAALPAVTRGLVLTHRTIAVGLLGAWRSEELRREVADLSASRGAAVIAEDRALRRLERDIHDGPQQRLVRLQLDLASAERRIDKDPEAAKRLVAEARERTRETLDELRALSRGFAPPLLQDRGLPAAIESLVASNPVPTVLEGSLDAVRGLPPEIERSVYFIVAELLTNVTKHSGATEARVHTALRADPRPRVRWLDVWVLDNGRGGAVPHESHGLAGLAERIRGLRGLFSVESPRGGPTVIGVHIPLTTAVAPTAGHPEARKAEQHR